MSRVIALMGYGMETRSAMRYFSSLYPDASYTIYDGASQMPVDIPTGVQYIVDDRQATIDVRADIVVRTPSFDPNRIQPSGKVTTVTREFFGVCPAPIIGVTGTKGKGTTSSLIARILEKAGMRVWLVGNIGHPTLEVLDEVRVAAESGERCIVVYELSSFQLWDLDKSPHIGLVLMIEEEHLDVHGDAEEYIDAKSNIAKHQTVDDVVIYFADNSISTEIASLSPGKKIPYTVDDGEYILVRDTPIIKKSELAIKGKHNHQNITAAVAAAMEYVDDVEVIAEAVRHFTGLPHRLEVCGVSERGVMFVNDSYSSAPPATVAAINAFSQGSIVIVGGKDRGLSFAPMAEAFKGASQVKRVIIIGSARQRIAESFEAVGFTAYEMSDEMTLGPIVKRADELAQPGDVVILSPGCASFDMFANFTDRGEQFRRIAKSL